MAKIIKQIKKQAKSKIKKVLNKLASPVKKAIKKEKAFNDYKAKAFQKELRKNDL